MELLLVPLTTKPLTQIVRLVVMTLVLAVIPRVTPEAVMTPVARNAEQHVINQKNVVMIQDVIVAAILIVLVMNFSILFPIVAMLYLV